MFKVTKSGKQWSKYKRFCYNNKKKGITNFVHETLVSDKIPIEWLGSKG